MVRTFRKSSLIIAVFIVFTAIAGNDEELFLRANKMYEAGDYDHALSLYEMIPHKGRAVLYNMGNCYFHKKDYADALVYWTRAEKGATSAEYRAIYHNKQHVLQALGKKSEETIQSRMKTFFESMMVYTSPLMLQILLLFLWIFFIFLYHRKRLKKMKAVALSIPLCIIATMLCMQQYKNGTKSGIIMQKGAPLFAGPENGFDCIASVDYGEHVIITQARKDWYKIRYFDNIGWIKADAIHVI